jgi:adenosylhomocysteine nucleosidase
MNFLVAFTAEARPVIDFYRLTKIEHSPCPIFRNDQHFLIICGMGREKSISATKTLNQVTKETNLGWINLGIAGHGSLKIGKAYIAGKVIDDRSEESFYPPQIFVQTCSHPSTQYQPNLGFDMEAHAFYKTASKFSIRELVQVIKIVSDNPDHNLNKFNIKAASAMIERHLEEIDALVKQIDTASLAMQSNDELGEIIKRVQSIHSFSVTRTHQLHDQLRNGKSLGVDLSEIEELIASASDASDAIRKVTHILESKRILG